MNLKFIVLIILFFNLQTGYTQGGAGTELKANKISNISSLCKVLGFLKYYHPNVAQGKYNWDEQLLITLSRVIKAKSKGQIFAICLAWIESLGAVKTCSSRINNEQKDYFNKNFDIFWIEQTRLFNDNLIKKLKCIEINRFQGKNYYLTGKRAGNIELRNQSKYDNFISLISKKISYFDKSKYRRIRQY
jgi:carboxyl-terminal processing protease